MDECGHTTDQQTSHEIHPQIVDFVMPKQLIDLINPNNQLNSNKQKNVRNKWFGILKPTQKNPLAKIFTTWSGITIPQNSFSVYFAAMYESLTP